MRGLGILFAVGVWLACALIAPASWWFNERILDEEAFTATMQEALQIEDVDTALTEQATSRVIDRAQGYVDASIPVFSNQAGAVLDRLAPTVNTLVGRAVNSQPGERAMLGMSQQAHNVFVAWLAGDTLGKPGLSADLASGQARFDLDDLLDGEQISIGGLITIPLDALELGSVNVGFPMPPDWLRSPLNLLKSALLPALLLGAAAGAALVLLDRGRTRALAWTAALTAAVCAGAAVFLQASWSVTGAADAEWTIARAVGGLLVDPWVQSYVVVAFGMLALALAGFGWDRYRFARSPAPGVGLQS